MHLKRLSAALVIGALSIIVLASVARADVEPNDNIVEAEGPLSAQTYSGTLQTEQDTDWYWVSLGSQQQITINANYSFNECQTKMEMGFYNYYGKEMATVEPEAPRDKSTGELLPSATASVSVPLTTELGGGVYYLKAFADTAYGSQTGCHYSFSVTPASAFKEAHSWPPIVSIPSSALSRRLAPLMKGEVVYQGQTSGESHPTWLEFIPRANQQVIFEVTDFCPNSNVHAQMSNGFEEEGQYAEATSNGRADTPAFSQQTTLPYYVEIKGGVGCGFQAEVGPANALVTKNAQRFSQPCLHARLTTSRHRQRIKTLYRKLHRADTYREIGRIHHLIEVQRAKLRASHNRAKHACT